MLAEEKHQMATTVMENNLIEERPVDGNGPETLGLDPRRPVEVERVDRAAALVPAGARPQLLAQPRGEPVDVVL
jgi:hypothetical protein